MPVLMESATAQSRSDRYRPRTSPNCNTTTGTPVILQHLVHRRDMGPCSQVPSCIQEGQRECRGCAACQHAAPSLEPKPIRLGPGRSGVQTGRWLWLWCPRRWLSPRTIDTPSAARTTRRGLPSLCRALREGDPWCVWLAFVPSRCGLPLSSWRCHHGATGMRRWCRCLEPQRQAISDDFRSPPVEHVEICQIYISDKGVGPYSLPSFSAHLCCRLLQWIHPPSQDPATLHAARCWPEVSS